MTKYVSQNSRDLLDIITREHALQAERVAGGWIEPDQMMPCLIERLNTLSMRNESLRLFLSGANQIPKTEDEDKDVEWAKDPRPANFHFVDHRPSEAKGSHTHMKDDQWLEAAWPTPGERVA